TPPPTTGTFAFYMKGYGPHQVWQGYNMYFDLLNGMLAGAQEHIDVAVSGIPPNTSVTFTNVLIGDCSASMLTATSFRTYAPGCSTVQVKVSPATSTPPGN